LRILFITSTRIGDAVLSTGLLGWLIERHPEARITIACGPLAAPLFTALPGLERIITLRKRPGGLHWLELWRACVRVRWDLVVDLRRSAIAWMLPTRTRRRLPTSAAPLHRVALIGRTLGLDPPPAPRLWTTSQHDAAAAKLLADAGPVLAVAPGANWPAKTWPAARFAELVQRLTRADAPLAGAKAVIACAAVDEAGAGPVMDAVPASRRIALVGEDLLTVFAVLRGASLFIGNDSGLMHMAAAAGVPTLGLFGPTDDRLYGPWGPACAVARAEESVAEVSALSPSGNLMTGLAVETVEQAALALYGMGRARTP